MTGRQEGAIHAVRVLRAKVQNDAKALAELLSPEVLALIGTEIVEELSPTPSPESLREHAEAMRDAYLAARSLYLGLADTADVLLDVVTDGDAARQVRVLDVTEHLLRTRPPRQ